MSQHLFLASLGIYLAIGAIISGFTIPSMLESKKVQEAWGPFPMETRKVLLGVAFMALAAIWPLFFVGMIYDFLFPEEKSQT